MASKIQPVSKKRKSIKDVAPKGINAFQFTLDSGKRYAHTATASYHLTMASLQTDNRKLPNCACNMINKSKGPAKDEDKVTVIIEHDLKEFILCILDEKKLPQCKLDLDFEPGEQVAFRTIGKIPVMLIGTSQ